MKKIQLIFLPAMLLTITSCASKKMSPKSGLVFRVTIPNNARQLNSDSVKAAEAALAHPRLPDLATRHYYEIGNIVLGYWEFTARVPHRTLDQRVSEAKGLAILVNNGETVSVKKYNGLEYIIMREPLDCLDKHSHIRFFSEYVNNDTISGDLKFKPKNTKEAEVFLEQLLDGIREDQ